MDAAESTPRTVSALPLNPACERDLLPGCQPECEVDVFVRMPPRETRKALGRVVRRVTRQPVIMLADDEPLPGSEG